MAVPRPLAVILPFLSTETTFSSDDLNERSVIEAAAGLKSLSESLNDASSLLPPRKSTLLVLLRVISLRLTFPRTLYLTVRLAFLLISSVSEYFTTYIPDFLVLIFLTFFGVALLLVLYLTV